MSMLLLSAFCLTLLIWDGLEGKIFAIQGMKWKMLDGTAWNGAVQGGSLLQKADLQPQT